MSVELVEADFSPKPRRRMWVYTSEEEFLDGNYYVLAHHQMKEAGIAAVTLTKEQRRLMDSGLRKFLRDVPLGECYPEPLCLEIPGKPLGECEAAVADLQHAKKSGSAYYVPVKIFASID